jgi:hypothetical protein
LKEFQLKEKADDAASLAGAKLVSKSRNPRIPKVIFLVRKLANNDGTLSRPAPFSLHVLHAYAFTPIPCAVITSAAA